MDSQGGESPPEPEVTNACGGGLGGGTAEVLGVVEVLSSLFNNEVNGGRAIGSSMVILRPTSFTVRRP